MIRRLEGRARLGRALPAIALALALAPLGVGLAQPVPVLAHAGVLQTRPSDGERLAVSPVLLAIDFTEAVGIGTGAVRLVDAAGAAIDLEPATGDGSHVTQALPPLADGWYLATWTVVSEDGHVVHGALAFAVGDAQGPPPNAPAGDGTTLTTIAARAVADGGLLVASGGIGAVLLLGAASRRVRRLVLGASVAGAAGGLALVAIAVADAGGAAFAAPALSAALLRSALLTAVAIGIVAGRWPVAGILAAAALACAAVGGHPGDGPLTGALFMLHLCGAALWLGAAPAVLLVMGDGSVSDASAEAVVRRFSRLATVTLVLAVGGGSLLALLLTGAFAAGVDVRYAVLLGLKVALVSTAALLGAATRRRLTRGAVERGRLRRLFLVDATLLAAVIALSAGLAAGAPTTAEAGEDDIHVGHCSLETGAGVASLSLVPAHVGDNTIHLDGAGTLDHARVELRRAGDPAPIAIDLERRGAGWARAAAIPVEGAWEAIVVIGRTPFDEERPACRMRVLP